MTIPAPAATASASRAPRDAGPKRASRNSSIPAAIITLSQTGVSASQRIAWFAFEANSANPSVLPPPKVSA